MRILNRKWRCRGFRHRWFQILRSRNKIRKELEKLIFDFWKWISRSQMPNSQSNFRFWGADFVFLKILLCRFRVFLESKFWKIEISNFGRVDVCIFIKFWFKISILRGLYALFLLASRFIPEIFSKIFFNRKLMTTMASPSWPVLVPKTKFLNFEWRKIDFGAEF